MSAIVQMNKIPLVQWKGQTFDQIQSFIRKNQVNDESNSKGLKFRANPLKIYRREIVSTDISNCNVRTSTKIDVFNRPNGTIINSSATNKYGLVNTIDNTIPNNSCETYENCSVILSPEENARRRVRSSGMIKKIADTSRDTHTYYTSSQQYLASRSLTFKQNQYNYIRSGDATSKPGSSLASNNLYSPNGSNYCKKYFIGEGASISYIWIDGTTIDISIPSGHYHVGDLNDLLKTTMISNHHYYTKRQVGLNPDPYRDVLTFLLNITYDNNKDVVQLQSFRTDDGIHPDTEYRVPINATWTKPASGAPLFPQFSIPANIIQTATGITVGDYPTSQSANTGLTFQTFESTSTPGLQPSYKKLYYKPNNPQFGQQGAVSSGDVITRKRYNTITNAASSYRNALGQSVANALAYGVPANGYTIKDKLGYPLKRTPKFRKHVDTMETCDVYSIKNQS